jgi:hypothetical protein
MEGEDQVASAVGSPRAAAFANNSHTPPYLLIRPHVYRHALRSQHNALDPLHQRPPAA